MSIREDLIELCLKVELGASQPYQANYVAALMDLCMRLNPDLVIEVGTYTGTSTLSLASALKLLGRPESLLTTIDISHSKWRESVPKHKAGFLAQGIDVERINAVRADFKSVDAADHIPAGGRVMLYYDIHDLEDRSGVANSPFLFKNWIPRIGEGIVAMHDVTPCPSDWERPKEWGVPCSFAKAEHWAGQWFWGNGETGVLIDWLNRHRAPINSIGQISMVWFRVKDGKPV
jgi:hypothetical protein